MTTTREAAMEAALKSMLHSVCGPTGFAEAVRHNSGLAYPWHSLDAAEAQACAALSTPATEPQGYVEGMREAARIVDERYAAGEMGNPGHHIIQALAAHVAPQPAADTRVVVKPLVWKPEDAPCTRFKAEALGGHMMIVELDPETHPGTYSVGVDLGGLCFKFVLAEYDDFPPKYTAPAKFDTLELAKAAAQPVGFAVNVCP